jgi:hypothetical protein
MPGTRAPSGPPGDPCARCGLLTRSITRVCAPCSVLAEVDGDDSLEG